MRGVITHDAKLGRLRLYGGRLSFLEAGGETAVFDVALADIGNVRFPFYDLGPVVRFDAGGKRYRLAFLASERRFKWSGAESATSSRRAAGASSGKPRLAST